MNLDEYLNRLGFTANPFSSTNAGDEPHLTDYFVPPPYFPAVLGTPAAPRSDIVLAPRGGGKTAQRIMLEVEGQDKHEFLCITYDNFGASENIKAQDATLTYHLSNVIRLLLVAILAEIDANENETEKLDDNEKALIKYQVSTFLGDFTAEDYDRAIKSLKNFSDKAEDLWRKYGGKIAAILNAFIEKYGFGKIDASGIAEVDKTKGESIRYHFQRAVGVASTLGIGPVYFLVDKVDELSITSRDAKWTFDFIEPLLIDLPTLETPNCGFKFFLWDQIDA